MKKLKERLRVMEKESNERAKDKISRHLKGLLSYNPFRRDFSNVNFSENVVD